MTAAASSGAASGRDSASPLDAFVREGRSWESDRAGELERSRRVAWRVAGCALAIAGLSVAAVAGLTPLKQTELRILRVDNVTGIVDVVTEMPDARTSYSETVNKFFVQSYVRSREGYSPELIEDFYNTVGLMSGEAEQQRYGAQFRPENPTSPLKVYGKTARVRVTVKSVSFIKPDIALVRYFKEVDRGTMESAAATHWAATVSFKYVGSPRSERDRAINPLGFTVSEYRNDPDSAIESQPVARAAAGERERQTAAQEAAAIVYPGLQPGVNAGARP